MTSNRWSSYCLISNDYTFYFNNKIYFVNRKFHFSFFALLGRATASNIRRKIYGAKKTLQIPKLLQCFSDYFSLALTLLKMVTMIR